MFRSFAELSTGAWFGLSNHRWYGIGIVFQAFAELSTGAWFGLVALSALAIWVLGLVTNAVMRGRGFGVILNGTFMYLGFVAGAATRFAIFGTL